MNINTTQENEEEVNFEMVLYQLSELIREGKRGNPELNSIVENGLNIARKTDDFYKEYGKIAKLRLDFLYKVIFEIWSYQHQNLLENLTNHKNKREKIRDYVDLLCQHKNLGVNILDDFNKLANISDEQQLTEKTFLIWRKNIDELIKFFNLPSVAYSTVRTRKSSGLSAKTRYVIFATFLCVMGIIIATLLLIQV